MNIQNSKKNGLLKSGCHDNVKLDGQAFAMPICSQIKLKKRSQVWWP